MTDALDGVRDHYRATGVRNLLEGRVGILSAMFEAAPTKTRIETENH